MRPCLKVLLPCERYRWKYTIMLQMLHRWWHLNVKKCIFCLYLFRNEIFSEIHQWPSLIINSVQCRIVPFVSTHVHAKRSSKVVGYRSFHGLWQESDQRALNADYEMGFWDACGIFLPCFTSHNSFFGILRYAFTWGCPYTSTQALLVAIFTQVCLGLTCGWVFCSGRGVDVGSVRGG